MRSICARALVAAFSILPLVGSGWAAPQDEAARPPGQVGTAEVNGVRLHYRVVGAGPPLLLLHGFTGAGSWWDPLLDDLSKDHTVIVPDLPAHGRSTGHPGPYLYRQAARDMYALLDYLGIGRFNAIGYSAGGIILLHMATQELHRIEAMTLVSAAHRSIDPVRTLLREWPELEANPEEMRSYWLRIHPGGEDQVRSLLDSLRSLADEGDNMSFTPESLSRIEARTLLVTGDRDPLVPLELALEMYRAIPDAAIWVVPSQGHSAIWPDWGGSPEAGRVFPDVVREFFRM